MAGLTSSVGIKGDNNPDDVELVQNLLKKAGAKLKADRSCGRITIGAICNFQRQFLPHPDGFIKNSDGPTFQKLLQGKVKIHNPWGMLPPSVFHYNYCAPNEDIRDRQWGTPQTIATTQSICHAFFTKHNFRISVGDISLVQGGPMNGHTSGHRIGKNVDIRPIRKDRANVMVKVSDTANYDRERSLALAKIIESFPNVRKVFFGDEYVVDNTGSKIELETAHHYNHFHVETFH
jgi:hypothetical protein